MTILADLLNDVAGGPPDKDQFLSEYGLGRNPFPPARTIYPEVMYNQKKALEKFASDMRAILGADLSRRSLAVIGGTGGGKSHFLRHCQHHVKLLKRGIITVEFSAGTGSAVSLIRELLRSADDHAKDRGEQDFLSAIVNQVRETGDFGPVRQTDLKNCLKKLVAASAEGYIPSDQQGKYTSDLLREVARRWLAGGTLTQTERNHLHVSGRLSTASLMVRVVTELFALARLKEILHGVMLCLDEIEALFVSGSSNARIQAFLQDVRYLFDEAVGKDSGYSLIVISASTNNGATNLRDFNYPLFQRLGFEQEARVQLHQVSSLEEAREFADVYLDFERERFAVEKSMKVSATKTHSLVSDTELSEALYGKEGSLRTVPTSQARLLEELHRLVERKRSSGSSE